MGVKIFTMESWHVSLCTGGMPPKPRPENEEQWWIPTSKRLPVAFLSFTKMNITSIFEINFKTIVSIKNQNKI